MNLANAISQAIQCTTRLHEAMGNEDVDHWKELLESRGQAMAQFESCHRNASAEEMNRCSPLLRELIEADQALQNKCNGNLDRLTAEFRENASSGPHSTSSGYNAPAQQACVNRKA